jgi:predicted nucleic acid-binding protein
VLVYAYSLDDARNAKAAALLASGGVVSVQVMNEFVNVARRKLRFEWHSVMRALDDLAALLDPPVPLPMDVHRAAVDVSRRYGFRIYDSLVLSAARLAGCRTLSSEDLQDGQTIDCVLVRDPFRSA